MVAVRKIVAAVVISAMAASPVLAAPVRPQVVSVPTAAAAPAPVAAGTRLGGRVAKKNQVLGAPLFLAFLGAVAVTIGTIAIVDDGSSSPQGR